MDDAAKPVVLMNAGIVQPENPSPQGYWDLVKKQFVRNRYAYVSFWVILVLFLIAAWAPVLANGKPFVWTEDGKTTYPLLRYLTAPTETFSVDHIFNYAMFASLTISLVFFAGWLVWRKDRRTLRRKWPLLLVGGLGLALVPFLDFSNGGVFRSWRLDSKDYVRIYTESESGSRNITATFPPVAADPITPTPNYLEAPSGRHWLGTDKDGRDVLARMLHGARISLSVGFISVGIMTLLGIFFGALAGYYRGWVDIAISRLIEIVICFPTFFLILTIVAFIDPAKRSVFHIMLVMGLVGWPGVARLVRGEFLKLADQDFVQAARALGVRNSRLMFRHMLPNAMGPVLVAAAFGVAGAILTESGLSYLGFGATPPTPTWGEMISQGKEYLDQAWWLLVYPGLSIFVTVTVYNLAGDGLRDAMDPKLRK